MIHPRLALSALCVVTFSHALYALAAPKQGAPDEKACSAARAEVSRFLAQDLKGARRALRPLAVTRESDIVGCTWGGNSGLKIQVRYQVVGIIQHAPEGAHVSLYLPGKGSHDLVFDLARSKAGFMITNADEIMPHVAPQAATEELRKELALAKDDIEKGSIIGAIAEIEKP